MKEVNVYKVLSPELSKIGFKIPNVYYTKADGDNTCEWFVLIIEALGEGWVVQDQVKGMGAKEWSLSVKDIAKLHARWWRDDNGLDVPWLSNPSGSFGQLDFWGPFFPSYPTAYTAFTDILRSGSSNERTKLFFLVKENGPYVTSPVDEAAGGVDVDLSSVRKMMEWLANEKNFMPIVEATNAVIRSRPRTLTFGDFRGDNIFSNTDKTQMAYIDFQLFNAGAPGYDFNQPLGSFGWDVFKEHETFISLYFEELGRLNPKAAAEYTREHFYEDWKIGGLHFITGLPVLGIGTFGQPADTRMADLWMYAFNRYAMALKELGVVAYVKGVATKLGLDLTGYPDP